MYRLCDVPEYWLIDPDEGAVEVWKLAASDDAEETAGRPGVAAE
jgi:Uma2 family endonuclease